jgi:hypothetical protein
MLCSVGWNPAVAKTSLILALRAAHRFCPRLRHSAAQLNNAKPAQKEEGFAPLAPTGTTFNKENT